MTTESNTDSLLRFVLVVLAAIVLLPMLMMVVAVPMMGMTGMWWGGGMMDGVRPLWGIVSMLVWVLVLVGIGFLAYRGLSSGDGPSLTGDQAIEELRLAYARGELTDEEFEERRSKLRRDESD